jgi:hypothetical protein
VRYRVEFVPLLALTVDVDAPADHDTTAALIAREHGEAWLRRLAEDTSQGRVRAAGTLDGIEPESVTTVDDEEQP